MADLTAALVKCLCCQLQSLPQVEADQSFFADARDIIVLGEHAIVLLDGRGRLVWQRRLEYHPAALTMPQVCN